MSNAIDDRYLRIERLHGRDGARIAAESHTAAIERIESIVREEQIDCDFERLAAISSRPMARRRTSSAASSQPPSAGLRHTDLLRHARGQGRRGVYIATGDSGMGMTHGTIAGMLLADLIAGRPSLWAALYDPARKMWRAPIEYAKENLNAAARYLDDYLGRGDIHSGDELAPGEGIVLRRGLAKIAAFRDRDGMLHEWKRAGIARVMARDSIGMGASSSARQTAISRPGRTRSASRVVV